VAARLAEPLQEGKIIASITIATSTPGPCNKILVVVASILAVVSIIVVPIGNSPGYREGATIMNGLGTAGDASLRIIDETQIIELLLLGGWAYEVQGGGREAATAATSAALGRWVRTGLPHSTDVHGKRRYDPVEVTNFMKWSSLRRADGFWTERFLRTGRQLVLDQGAGVAFPDRFDRLPDREFTVVLSRRFNLSSIAPGTPIRLRLPLPLEDRVLKNLRLDVRADFDATVDFVRLPGRLEARLDAPNDTQLSFTYRAKFCAGADTSAPGTKSTRMNQLDAEEFALYTRLNEGFIRVTPKITSIAQDLSKGSQNTLDIVYAFWAYLIDHMMCGAIHYHEIDMTRPMDWLIDIGWYDCHLGSALLVSLCRAVQIPARIIGGYMLYPLAPSHHFWAEIWIEDSGWRPFDLLSWDLSGGGRDSTWRNCFAESLDYRMKTQCLPRTFVGPMSVPVPHRWHIMMRAISNGICISLIDAASGQFTYSDDISVKQSG
jgi:hypothetical protein